MRWRSEVDLHLPPAATPGQPDLELRLGERQRAVSDAAPVGEVLAHLSERDGRPLYTFVRDDDGVLLRFHRLCEFRLEPDLRRATCHTAAGTDDDFVAVLAAGMLATTVLMLRGHPVLHGSAVEQGGSALAMVGASGMGKSTLSTLLCRTGAALVTDDVLRLDVEEQRLVCRSGSAESRLRPRAVHLSSGAATRTTADGRSAVHAALLAPDRVPLRAILVPYPSRDVQEVRIEVLPAAAALVELLRFPRVVGWQELASTARHFGLLGEVARRLPVARIRLPWSDTVKDDLAHALRRVLADAGELSWP